MIDYISLGAHKKLNEIVFAGSHDAGITGGGDNVQTQDLDIVDQAYAGVRIFDLRVAAQTLPDYTFDGKDAELRTFHADPKLQTSAKKTRFVTDVGRSEKIERTKLRGGAWGMGLTQILQEARTFVEFTAPSEFLILKFDKSTNWPLIAETCTRILGDFIYKGGGNVNTKTLGELRRKVIVGFTPKGYDEAAKKGFGPAQGIVAINNLAGGGSYNPNYKGIQYFGKGGTSPFKPFRKIQQNIDKQGKLMKKGVGTDPEVMGMMYWTTTGLLESIKERNDTMWTKVKKEALKKLWTQGLYASIQERIGATLNGKAYSTGPVLKAFMPNIVMIDFADEDKCKTIYELNTVASVDLADVASVLNA